jgi:hypothetical protein
MKVNQRIARRNVLIGSTLFTWFCIVLFTIAAASVSDISVDRSGGRLVASLVWVLVLSIISSIVIVYLVIGALAGNSTVMTDEGVYAVTNDGPIFIRWDQVRQVVARSQIYTTHYRLITNDAQLDIVPGPLGGSDAVRAELSRHLPASMLGRLY